ncbi:hypothetical protein [Roseateles depolymerans]|uniref:Uncharacterized protein n=1 Tax=Roseateles depolymerans TaxID=76731 RepID=A0A0U3MZ82_9BURK|nr:hypothetical protein [Roseateles depolymerans]ALV08291.1 hypothetical protein RD2015_3840 [Roseateles depolymerans]REG21485.1 hypothetical protein DES44_0604 [Roseateles depolymerans]
MNANGLAEAPARWPHEIAPDPLPDGRLRPLGMMESLAGRRARLAEAALARARHAQEQACLALEEARQALEDRVAFVAQERIRLRDERQASPDAGMALRRWREADQRLLDSIPPCRQAVTDCEQALERAEVALLQAQETHRQRTRRHEKFGMLIEQIVEEAA